MDIFYLEYDDFNGRLDRFIDKLNLKKEYYWLFSDIIGYPQQCGLNFYNAFSECLKPQSEVLAIARRDGFLWESGLISLFGQDKSPDNIESWGRPVENAFMGRVGFEYPLQHPLAEVEIRLNEDSGLCIRSLSDEFTACFLKAYPNARGAEELLETLSARNEKQKKRGKILSVLLTLIFSALTLAAVYLLDVIIFAEMLGWEENDGFLPWGVISIVLLVLPLLLLVPYCIVRRNYKGSPSMGEKISNVQIRDELDFLLSRGFSYRLYKIPLFSNKRVIDVHRFERNGLIIEVARSVVKGSGENALAVTDFKWAQTQSDGSVSFKDLTQSGGGSQDERDGLAFAVSRRKNMFSLSKDFLYKYVDVLTDVPKETSESLTDGNTDGDIDILPDSIVSPASESRDGAGAALPPEFFELEVQYNRRLKLYRFAFVALMLILAIGIIAVIVAFNPQILHYEGFSSVTTVILVPVLLISMSFSGYMSERFSKRLTQIRARQKEIFKEATANTPLPDMPRIHISAEPPAPVKTTKPRPMLPAAVLAFAAIVPVAAGALLKDVYGGFFGLGIALTFVMLAAAFLYMLKCSVKKSVTIPSVIFLLFVLPFFVASFLTEGSAVIVRAAAYSAAVTFVCCIGISLLVFVGLLPKKRRHRLASHPDFLYVIAMSNTEHYIYYKNLRAVISFSNHKIQRLVFQRYGITDDGLLLFTDINEEPMPPQNIYLITQKLKELDRGVG